MADKVNETAQIEHVADTRASYDVNPKTERQGIDPALEKKVLRKVDLNLVPILFLLFLCAFIDR